MCGELDNKTRWAIAVGQKDAKKLSVLRNDFYDLRGAQGRRAIHTGQRRDESIRLPNWSTSCCPTGPPNDPRTEPGLERCATAWTT
jgi:hypothetical protein